MIRCKEVAKRAWCNSQTILFTSNSAATRAPEQPKLTEWVRCRGYDSNARHVHRCNVSTGTIPIKFPADDTSRKARRHHQKQWTERLNWKATAQWRKEITNIADQRRVCSCAIHTGGWFGKTKESENVFVGEWKLHHVVNVFIE